MDICTIESVSYELIAVVAFGFHKRRLYVSGNGCKGVRIYVQGSIFFIVYAFFFIYDVFIKFMKSAWKKKKSGVGNMLSCMLGMLFLVMVMYLGLDMYARVNMAINKSRIERTYILYMETYGYLTPEKRDRLTKELSDMGVSNISYAGTTMSMAGYGQEIVLSVTGILRMNSVAEVGQNFVFVRGGEENFRIYQKSTAKNIQD